MAYSDFILHVAICGTVGAIRGVIGLFYPLQNGCKKPDTALYLTIAIVCATPWPLKPRDTFIPTPSAF